MEDKESHAWMDLKAEQWNQDKNYQKFRNFARNIDVVNDRAERGIKLIQDFIHSSRNEEHLQNLIIVMCNE